MKKILGRIKLLALSFQAMELMQLGYDPQHGVDYHFLTKAKGYLNAGGSYFVIVGAGHIIGERGIVELLKSKGYIVEQL